VLRSRRAATTEGRRRAKKGGALKLVIRRWT
jgi:hypothetical protein